MQTRTGLAMVAALAVAWGCGGCASLFPSRDTKVTYDQAHWQRDVHDNQRRLAGLSKSPIQKAVEQTEDAPWVLPKIGSAAGVVWSVPRSLVGGMIDGIGDFLRQTSGKTPAWAVGQMFDSTSADNRRTGIAYLSDIGWARKGSYLDAYRHAALEDDDFIVRAAAIHALNQARDSDAVGAFLAGLEDSHPLVRIEAAKALANVPDPRAVEPLKKHLLDVTESKDVRLAAADALRCYRTSEIAQLLIQMLQDHDFGVAWQSLQSLKLMTGKDFGYNQGAWLGYLTGPDKPFG